jgi:hypothetical protein
VRVGTTTPTLRCVRAAIARPAAAAIATGSGRASNLPAGHGFHPPEALTPTCLSFASCQSL